MASASASAFFFFRELLADCGARDEEEHEEEEEEEEEEELLSGLLGLPLRTLELLFGRHVAFRKPSWELLPLREGDRAIADTGLFFL